MNDLSKEIHVEILHPGVCIILLIISVEYEFLILKQSIGSVLVDDIVHPPLYCSYSAYCKEKQTAVTAIPHPPLRSKRNALYQGLSS